MPATNLRCLVVGAASGIGQATAERLSRSGNRVVSADLPSAHWPSAHRPGQDSPNPQLSVDIADPGSVRDTVEQAAALLDAMDNPGLDRATFHELDARFHVALSSLAGNAVVATMMESLSGSIVGYVKGAMDAMESWPDVLCELRSQHHGIFDAVRARDGELAARLLREHIEWFYIRAQEATPPHSPPSP